MIAVNSNGLGLAEFLLQMYLLGLSASTVSATAA